VRPREGVSFAPTFVHGTVIGDGCAIGDHAVLGKLPVLSAHSARRRGWGARDLRRGLCRARAAVVFAWRAFPAIKAIVWDQSFCARSGPRIGAVSVIGRAASATTCPCRGTRAAAVRGLPDGVYGRRVTTSSSAPGVRRQTTQRARHGPRRRFAARIRACAAAASAGAPSVPGIYVGEACIRRGRRRLTRDVTLAPQRGDGDSRAGRARGAEQDLLRRWR